MLHLSTRSTYVKRQFLKVFSCLQYALTGIVQGKEARQVVERVPSSRLIERRQGGWYVESVAFCECFDELRGKTALQVDMELSFGHVLDEGVEIVPMLGWSNIGHIGWCLRGFSVSLQCADALDRAQLQAWIATMRSLYL